RLKSANSRIHADDQLYACRRSPFNHVLLHPVTFFDPVGDVKIGGAAAKLNRGFQDDDCRGSVDVVVAIDQDLLSIDNGSAYAFDGFTHAAHQVRRVQLLQ